MDKQVDMIFVSPRAHLNGSDLYLGATHLFHCSPCGMTLIEAAMYLSQEAGGFNDILLKSHLLDCSPQKCKDVFNKLQIDKIVDFLKHCGIFEKVENTKKLNSAVNYSRYSH